MCVAPCSWRTRISLILESTRASKIGIAAPPDRPKTYSTPSRSRQRMSASAPVWNFVTGAAAMGGAESSGVDLFAGDAGTGNLAFKKGGPKVRRLCSTVQPFPDNTGMFRVDLIYLTQRSF